MPTEYQELTKAISLIEEMNEYLSFAGGANICTGSIFHQQMMGILDDFYEKRKKCDIEPEKFSTEYQWDRK